MFYKQFLTITCVLMTTAACYNDMGAEPIQESEQSPQGDLSSVQTPELDEETTVPAVEESGDEETQTREDDSAPPADHPATCGNGELEAGEICDGHDLGHLTCRSVGFAGGEARCATTCTAIDTRDCVDLLATPIAPEGDALRLVGTLVEADPVWQRPSAACDADAEEEGQYSFDAFAFTNTQSEAKEIRVHADWGDQDGFLHLYSHPWNPMTNEGCVAGNDDGATLHQSEIGSVMIPAGETMVVALSTYQPGQSISSYTLDVETIQKSEDTIGNDDTIEDTPPVTDDDDTTIGDDDDTPADPVCGNNKVEAGEVCDGNDLGSASCSEMGYAFGVVVCGDDCNSYLNFCFGSIDDDSGDDEDDWAPPPADPATPIPAPGLTLRIDGELTIENEQWQRVGEDCHTMLGNQYYYAQHRVENQSSDTRFVNVRANWTSDGFLAVFDGSASLPNAQQGCLAADDDYAANQTGTVSRLGSLVEDIALAPGQEIIIVSTTYSEGETMDDYSIEVTTRASDDIRPTAQVELPGRDVTSSGIIHETDAFWNRIDDECGSEAKPQDYYFDPLYVENSTGETQELDIVANWQEGDGYLHVYLLDASNQPTNTGLCLGANDDSVSSHQSQVSGANMAIYPGEVFVILASTYSPSDAIGKYDIVVSTVQ